jgi:23S rRNA (cytidine1920-2'-O)/16S rRNA (cytidine1409-2'-O)-methyltransferase|tara:strand:+ start:1051 stop:1647 length:597 start_codon:yes stop_codon:yes gene_type:complete
MNDSSFVSRAGLKLEHILTTFDFDVTGLTCADLGCNVGGFTDCLLQRGASHVFAVDTGYGTLAWKLRSDERVTTLERTNALHVEPPELVDLVVIDLGWTPQKLALPAGIKWTNCGHIITLIKPHYELTKEEKSVEKVGEGLSENAISRVIARTKILCQELSLELLGETLSPIRGKKSSKKGTGNCEYLMLLKTRPNCQ